MLGSIKKLVWSHVTLPKLVNATTRTQTCNGNSGNIPLGCSYSNSSKSNLKLNGIFPPIPTPFNTDESIAFEKLASNLEKWQKISFSGYVVQGSNGEYTMLSPEERVEMVRKVREFIGPQKMIIAGSSCESTRATIKMSQKMADVGADAVLILTPHYFKSSMTSSAMEKFFVTVADESPVPVILYNMPANTGIDMGPDLLISLAAHSNIIGLKDSGGDITKIGRVVKETELCDFQVVAGSAGFLFPALVVGCVGGVLGLANILGGELCHLFQLVQQSKMKEALDLHQRLIVPNSLVTRELGVPAMKKACELAGLYGGPCRSPLQPLNESQILRVKKAFQQSGFL